MQARSAGRAAPRSRRVPSDPFLLGAIVLVGLVLRWPGFNASLFADELSSFFLTGHSAGRLLHLLNGHSVDLTPPLYFLIASGTRALAGNSVQSLRLISLIAGVAAIPLTQLLGRWTVDRRAGLVGASLVALSPYLLYYSTEARAYSLLMALSLGSTLALLKALQNGRLGWWIAYGACACATAYTHYTGVFVLAGQFAWAFFTHPGARRQLLLATSAAAIGFLPWLSAFLESARSPGAKVIGQLEPFTLHSIRIDLGRWSLGRPYLALASEPGSLAVALVLAGLTVASVAAVARLRTARDTDAQRWRQVALTPLLALATPIGLALYSLLGTSVWDQRDLIASWPGLAVTAGGLLTIASGVVRWAATALVLGGFAIGGVGMLRATEQRPDYLSAARFVDRVGGSGDPVVEVAAFTPGPLTEMEAALALQPAASAHPHPVLRIGLPPLGTVLRAPPYAALPIPTGAAIGRQAVRLAPHGTVFLVAAGALPAAALQEVRAHGRPTELGPLGFLEAVPPRFRIVEAKTFRDGFTPVSVYVLSTGAGPSTGTGRLRSVRTSGVGETSPPRDRRRNFTTP